MWLVDNDIIHEFLWIIRLCMTCLLQISTKKGFSSYFDHRGDPFWIVRFDDILVVVQTIEHSHFRISAATSRHIQLYFVRREDSCISKRPITYRSTADEIDHMLKIRLMNQMMDSICSVILSFDNNHQKLHSFVVSITSRIFHLSSAIYLLNSITVDRGRNLTEMWHKTETSSSLCVKRKVMHVKYRKPHKVRDITFRQPYRFLLTWLSDSASETISVTKFSSILVEQIMQNVIFMGSNARWVGVKGLYIELRAEIQGDFFIGR